jgi:hypothetical protein
MSRLLARMEPTFAPGACARTADILAKITTIKTKTTR